MYVCVRVCVCVVYLSSDHVTFVFVLCVSFRHVVVFINGFKCLQPQREYKCYYNDVIAKII